MKPPEGPLLIDHAALRRLGIKLDRFTLWRLEAKGQWPRRVKIGSTTYWKWEEVSEFIDRL
jgi:predicted DNA-binding transcriptional regulator AlpA